MLLQYYFDFFKIQSKLSILKHQTLVTGNPYFDYSGLETILSKIFMISWHPLFFQNEKQ